MKSWKNCNSETLHLDNNSLILNLFWNCWYCSFSRFKNNVSTPKHFISKIISTVSVSRLLICANSANSDLLSTTTRLLIALASKKIPTKMRMTTITILCDKQNIYANINRTLPASIIPRINPSDIKSLMLFNKLILKIISPVDLVSKYLYGNLKMCSINSISKFLSITNSILTITLFRQ